MQAQAAADKPLVVKGAAGQTANLQEWQDGSGAVRGRVAAGGNRQYLGGYAGTGIAPGTGAAQFIGSTAAEGDRAGFYLSHESAASGYGFFFYVDGNCYQDNYGDGNVVFRSGAGYQALLILSQQGNICYAYSGGAVGLRVRLAPSQTANAVEVQNSSGGVLASISPGGDVEVTDAARGLILKAPNGTRYRVTVSNAGTLVTTAI